MLELTSFQEYFDCNEYLRGLRGRVSESLIPVGGTSGLECLKDGRIWLEVQTSEVREQQWELLSFRIIWKTEPFRTLEAVRMLFPLRTVEILKMISNPQLPQVISFSPR